MIISEFSSLFIDQELLEFAARFDHTLEGYYVQTTDAWAEFKHLCNLKHSSTNIYGQMMIQLKFSEFNVKKD